MGGSFWLSPSLFFLTVSKRYDDIKDGRYEALRAGAYTLSAFGPIQLAERLLLTTGGPIRQC